MPAQSCHGGTDARTTVTRWDRLGDLPAPLQPENRTGPYPLALAVYSLSRQAPSNTDRRTGNIGISYRPGRQPACLCLDAEPGAFGNTLPLPQRVIHKQREWLDDVVRARRPQWLPVILSRDGIGLLPGSLLAATREQLTVTRHTYNADLQEGYGQVALPYALERK
jgi:hypothetical protein